MPILQYATDARNKIVLGASAAIGILISLNPGVPGSTITNQVRNGAGVVTFQVTGSGDIMGSGATTIQNNAYFKNPNGSSIQIVTGNPGSYNALYFYEDPVGTTGTESNPGQAFGFITNGDNNVIQIKSDKLQSEDMLYFGSGAFPDTITRYFRIDSVGKVYAYKALSGTTLTLSGYGKGAGFIPCFKSGGAVGYQQVTSSGTLKAGGCQ